MKRRPRAGSMVGPHPQGPAGTEAVQRLAVVARPLGPPLISAGADTPRPVPAGSVR